MLVGGDPQSTAGVPGESYLFDVGGNRFARQDRRGFPIITVRDAGGQPLAEYTKKSSDNFPKLDRDFVYGAGKLLFERVVTGVVPHNMGTDPVRTGTAYNFSVDQGAGTGSYDVDIQTGSGYQNYVTGIQLGSGNSFTLAESTLAPNETNFVRIRGANPSITNYSQIVSLAYDPSISSSSQNPVRALSVSRSGTNVALKWEVAGTTTKRFRVYFRLADGSTTYLLSPVSLPSSTRTLTLSDQSLTQVCGDFFVKIVLSDSPLTESAASPYNRLGSAQSGITGPLNPCGGGSGSNPISYTFANSYHHRDHLGSLRAETDEAGNRSVKRDYYAFGIEIPNGFESSAQAATRRQFTEAERGVYNGLDYMMARFCSGNAGRFLSPDVVVGNVGNPQSWNRYSYVMNSPLNYTDPSGKIYISPNQEAGPHGGNDPMTRTGSQERMGGYVTFFVTSGSPPRTTSTTTTAAIQANQEKNANKRPTDKALISSGPATTPGNAPHASNSEDPAQICLATYDMAVNYHSEVIIRGTNSGQEVFASAGAPGGANQEMSTVLVNYLAGESCSGAVPDAGNFGELHASVNPGIGEMMSASTVQCSPSRLSFRAAVGIATNYRDQVNARHIPYSLASANCNSFSGGLVSALGVTSIRGAVPNGITGGKAGPVQRWEPLQGWTSGLLGP